MATADALKPKDKVNYMLAVTLTGEQVMALESTQKELSGTATYLLQELARGGMMLDSGTVEAISSTTGEITHPSDVLRAVEHANHRDSGRCKAEIFWDPAYDKYYQELAASRGTDAQHMFQDTVNFIQEKGWLDIQLPETAQVLLTMGQRTELEEMLGVENLTGQDLYDFIAEHSTAPSITPLVK